MKYQRLMTILGPLSLTACGIVSNDSQLNRSEVPSSYSDTAVLGQSFHSQKKKFLNTICVDGTIDETQGNTEASFDLKTDLTWSQVVDRLGGTLSAGVNFPVVRAGASANYAKELAATNLSTTFNYNWSHTPKKQMLRPGSYKLTHTGESIASNQAALFDKCGDEFVNAIEYGASLNVNMKLEFLNETDKLKVGGMLKVNVGKVVDIVTVEGKLDYLDEKAKKNIKITIQARQRGGDEKRLANIIPDNLFTCDLANPEPCLKLFEEAIKYSKTDLPQQLSDKSKYNIIKYITESYDESNITQLVPTAGYPVVSDDIEDMRQKISDAYERAIVDQAFALRLTTTYKELLSPEEFQKISSIEAMAKENTRIFERASIACYDDLYRSCLAKGEEAFKNAKSYNSSDIAFKTSKPSTVNLIINGGFEEPAQNTPTGYALVSNLPGWTIAWVNSKSDCATKSVNPAVVEIARGDHTSQYAELDSHCGSSKDQLDARVRISQEIQTVPGKTYKLSYKAWRRTDKPELISTQLLTVYIDGKRFAIDTPEKRVYEQTFQATSAKTKIEFADEGKGDSIGVRLDEVSVFEQ